MKNRDRILAGVLLISIMVALIWIVFTILSVMVKWLGVQNSAILVLAVMIVLGFLSEAE